MKRDCHNEELISELDGEIMRQRAEIARMRPVFNAAIGVCVTGKATLPQLIDACARAARKAKGKAK